MLQVTADFFSILNQDHDLSRTVSTASAVKRLMMLKFLPADVVLQEWIFWWREKKCLWIFHKCIQCQHFCNLPNTLFNNIFSIFWKKTEIIQPALLAKRISRRQSFPIKQNKVTFPCFAFVWTNLILSFHCLIGFPSINFKTGTYFLSGVW